MRTLIALILLTCIVSPVQAFETRRMVFEHDGERRQALVDFDPDIRNAPMLVVLHGGLAGPLTVRRRAGVTLAGKGWVVAWPSAIDDWNDGRVDWNGNPYDTADDIGFLRRMIQDLSSRGIVDPGRVFFAGPSIGGVMALRLLCDAPDMVAGVAVAIASFPSGTPCRSGPPKPILYIHGTDDDIMPAAGGRIGGWNPLVRDRGHVDSVKDTVAHLARRNRCSGFEENALPDIAKTDDSTVSLRTYRNCAEPIVHYIVQGGGHTWPGSPESRLSLWVGKTNRDFSATRVVEEFFQAHISR